ACAHSFRKITWDWPPNWSTASLWVPSRTEIGSAGALSMSEIGLFEAIHSVCAIRYFRPDSVLNDLISQILDAAIQALSAGNNQNWLFVVVTDADLRRRLGDIFCWASVWVREKYNSNSRPAYINDAQYKKFWASGVYLHEHM